MDLEIPRSQLGRRSTDRHLRGRNTLTASTIDVIRVSPQGPSEWDERFEGLSKTGICQSQFYARVIERVYGAEPLYLKVIDSERDLAFCLMLKRRRPGILAMLPVATLECIDGRSW